MIVLTLTPYERGLLRAMNAADQVGYVYLHVILHTDLTSRVLGRIHDQARNVRFVSPSTDTRQ